MDTAAIKKKPRFDHGTRSSHCSTEVLPMNGPPANAFPLSPLPRFHEVERVEYPARIVHLDRAIASLGGPAELVQKFSKKKGASKDEASSAQLSLRLGLAMPQHGSSDAARSTALTGDSSASRGFLLCITVDDTGVASEAAVVASYERTHSFRRLADFVFRRAAPSAALHIASPGVINGVSPSLTQVHCY
jgi:hypothetical protein